MALAGLFDLAKPAGRDGVDGRGRGDRVGLFLLLHESRLAKTEVEARRDLP